MKKITITINIKAGSKFQEGFVRNSIKLMLEAFIVFFKSNHKKNDANFNIQEE